MPCFPIHQSRERIDPAGDHFRELHLYHGSRCNRACSFCTVEGGPDGWFEPLSPVILDTALRWVALDGNLKFYGGEPTLDFRALIGAFRYLRAQGFEGWLTVFSNGVLAERVIALLEADERCEVVLNYSILHGEGAEPLPPASRRRLEGWAHAHPDRLFASHPDLVPVGRAEGDYPRPNGPERAAFDGRCPRCHPVLSARGRLYACPFAVDYALPHHDLGDTASPAEGAVAAHRRFLAWIGRELEPWAAAVGVHPCRACVRWGSPTLEDITAIRPGSRS